MGHGIEAHEAADAEIGIEAQTPEVDHSQQKQIESQSIAAVAGRKPVSEEALVLPTDAWKKLAEPIRP